MKKSGYLAKQAQQRDGFAMAAQEVEKQMENNDKLIESLRRCSMGVCMSRCLLLDSQCKQMHIDAADALANYALRCDSDAKIIHSLQQSCDALAEENRHYKKQLILENKGQDLWSDENIRAERLAEENKKLAAENRELKAALQDLFSHAVPIDLEADDDTK